MSTNATLADLSKRLDDLEASTNGSFLIIASIIIFLMQGGFAFLEAGKRQKHWPGQNVVQYDFTCIHPQDPCAPRTQSTS